MYFTTSDNNMENIYSYACIHSNGKRINGNLICKICTSYDKLSCDKCNTETSDGSLETCMTCK